AVWKGGFIRFDAARHGFMGGTIMNGELLSNSPSSNPPPPFVYRGFYRLGPDVVFSYQREGKEFLTSGRLDSKNHFTVDTAPATKHRLHAALQGGPAQWPQWIETKGTLGKAKPYALDTLTLPLDNPWKTLFFVTGHDFFSNGDAAICTMTGEVWLCRGIDGSLQHLRWKRFATGLHQSLGLKIIDDKIYLLGRDQITRLHDLNGDDEADFYECVSNAQVTSSGGHSFITGLDRDAEGRFYFASGNQGLCRVKPGEPVEVLATGFRNPNGLGLARDGTVTTSVQEGDWTPASAICQIKAGSFYGHGGPKNGEVVEPPLAYLPRGIDNSSGGQCFADSDRWGPLGGQLIHFSPGAANHFAILREEIGGQWQSATIPLPGDFLSGAQQGRINPKDGQLYVSGMFGWGVYAPADGCFQRMRYTGGPAFLPVAVETRDNGVMLTFSDVLDPMFAGDAKNHFAQCWNYRYSAAYGSPEISLRHPGVPGHDPLDIVSAHLLAGGKTLFLEIPQLQPANTVHLHVSADRDVSREIFLTAHRLGAPFQDFPGYRMVAKIPLPSAASTAGMLIPPPAKPNPWREGEKGRAITIEAALGLQFAQKQFTVAPGERVSLTFKNPDVVPHNWVLLQRGRLTAVGDLANKMITDPKALSRHYVPESPDVLVYSDMANPGASFTIHFNAPQEPGAYPYICTFPGHWMAMNGVMTVR
ncbi:MAG TPA: plastocyanin/azurin family copper-binding protein, partial [Verrucomicrobiaceae bacterium]